ncbi:MAG TPA: secondary thiamine-phosphate synthase enzyme YjbQ [Saprospiraceae bacterium]|nr:secondary thiamine-phosphate synthase enzyme YjbQ [Saprospiraceae bacterium]
MIIHKEILLPPFPRGFHLITEWVLRELDNLPKECVLNVFIHHTSAGLTINENADKDVRTDFESIFNTLIPENLPFLTHVMEGPDDMPAHIKSSLVGSSVSIPVSKGRLMLGTWQGIYLCEFRNRGGRRKITVSIIS